MSDTLAETIGLGELIDTAPIEFDPKLVRAKLRKLHQAAEKTLQGAKIPACLSRNIERLSALVGLSDTDYQILGFAVMIQGKRLLDEAAERLGRISSKAFHALSVG